MTLLLLVILALADPAGAQWPGYDPYALERKMVQSPERLQMEQALALLEVELKSLKAEEAEIRAEMAKYQARIPNTRSFKLSPRTESDLQQLERLNSQFRLNVENQIRVRDQIELRLKGK